SLGELSRPNGGRIVGHRSHRNGRDADIAFYLTDREGEPLEADRFIGVPSSGETYVRGAPARFDDAANYRLIESLLTDPYVDVQYVFASNAIRQRLLHEARRRNALPALVERIERVLMQPGHGHPHRDHFHIRTLCTAADLPSCRDRGPYWSWVMGPRPSMPWL